MTLVKRAGKVAFYGVPGTGNTVVYTRMKGFTEMSVSKNPKEYTRQYVDEDFEQTDVTGYSPSISYAFDLYQDNTVHTDIVAITDGERIGAEAIRSILVVDFTDGNETDGYKAVKRDFTVIPDAEGGSMDAYTYSGAFKVKGKAISGTADVTEDVAVFTAEA